MKNNHQSKSGSATISPPGRPRRFRHGTVRVNLHLEPEMAARVKKAAEKRGQTINDFIRDALAGPKNKP